MSESQHATAPSTARIVLVDDDALVLKTFERVLHGIGELVSCGTALAALDVLRGGGVAAVVSDVSMPEMTGFDLLRAAREIVPMPSVILVTGVPTQQGEQMALELGVFRYMTKPFRAKDLRETVRSALARHASHAAAPRAGE